MALEAIIEEIISTVASIAIIPQPILVVLLLVLELLAKSVEIPVMKPLIALTV